jgi:hypothetical protein
MEEYLKLENFFAEIEGIQDIEFKEKMRFLYRQAGAEACLGFLDAPEFLAVMQEKNELHNMVEASKLQAFFKRYQVKMLGEGGLE